MQVEQKLVESNTAGYWTCFPKTRRFKTMSKEWSYLFIITRKSVEFLCVGFCGSTKRWHFCSKPKQHINGVRWHKQSDAFSVIFHKRPVNAKFQSSLTWRTARLDDFFVSSDVRLFAQELLEIGNGHIDAVPSNGRRSTQDEEGDVCPISGRSAIFNQAIH